MMMHMYGGTRGHTHFLTSLKRLPFFPRSGSFLMVFALEDHRPSPRPLRTLSVSLGTLLSFGARVADTMEVWEHSGGLYSATRSREMGRVRLCKGQTPEERPRDSP